MIISLKLCFLYTVLVGIFNFLDKKRLYNNLIFLTLLITIFTIYFLNLIKTIDLTFTVSILILARYIINKYFYKIKKIRKEDKVYINAPVPLIISGDIKYESLKKIKKNSFWLIDNMEKNHLELDNIFYAFYINKETYFIRKS